MASGGMQMSRFFIPGMSASVGDIIAMDGENARHALSALRLAKGEAVTVCDAYGTDFTCLIIKTAKTRLELEILSKNANQSEPSLRVRLFTSLIKSDRLEYTVQKAVELGVCGIYPFESKNSVARKNNEKTARLSRIAEAAAKQSGRAVIPHVSHPLDFEGALDRAALLEPGIMLAAHEKSDLTLKKIIQNNFCGSVTIFIGPEGGFTDNEAKAFEGRGIKLFSLGKRVLRAETAAVAALACVMYELGE
jgi:16S rRNA (uracil1498-N3)-methyltransferase